MSIALNVEAATPPWTELAQRFNATVRCGPVSAHTSERDWLELFAELFAHPPAALPCERIARLLCLTFRSTACSYSRVVDETVVDGMIWFHDDWIIDPPRAPRRPCAAAALGAVGAVALRAWDDLGPPTACPDRLSLPVPLPGSGSMAFVLGRDGPYGSAESRLATTLWSLLATLDRRIAAESSTAARRPAAVPLTRRELDVLEWLAAGLTAVAIAHRLSISVRTVHKHLERVYEKLGVTDRLAAVLVARQTGLIAD
jgi:DNA-binding CsgD family transcriptional regulator